MKILFDFGGVIVDLKKEACISAFDALGFDIRPHLGTYYQGGAFRLLENGDIDCPAFFDAIRQECGLPLSDLDITRAWEAYLTGIPRDRLSLIRRIRQHYPTYVLSNTNPIHWEQGLRDFFPQEGYGIDDYFDHLFLSYELHKLKPDAEIYQTVVDTIGGDAADILFLDDSEANCQAARDAGLQARIAPAGGEWMRYFDENGRLL